ncbi:MAG: NAD-dependent epimerase/dehydratase family protein [Sphingobacteriaceae bacterium]|nr:MAG: NAD-dependent epimerase/dehydratase family protein [Sphingobacteriaceae bacterium]
MDMLIQKPIEIWGGIEATINRVGDQYLDQSEYSGHYKRENDIDLIASLGIKMLRYPVLWEKHQPEKNTVIDWNFTEKNLLRLKELNVEPIAGLVHHGSGPKFVNFFDGSFESGVAAYARLVAEKFPWLEYYTPVNEPLTTARFCGLYGHWYPHESNEYCFYKILLSECKATVMAMQAIRTINPDAKLIQTEDLGKVYSTPLLQYQADFENERRWLSYDLITGTLTPEKMMWGFLLHIGILEDELRYFLDNNCKPHIAGFNYYITSERYLDENLQHYPEQVNGGNGRHQYADVEVVRIPYPQQTGPYLLIKEAWQRFNLPIAITECHIHCTREEQMRWFNELWQTLNQLKTEGVDIRALTAWALLGTFGWNELVTKPRGVYESGVFNLKSGQPRPTAIAVMMQKLAENNAYDHPVLKADGWWHQEKRIAYPDAGSSAFKHKNRKLKPRTQPVLIVGNFELIGTGFSKICEERNIHSVLLDTSNSDLNNRETIAELIKKHNPWAIINTADLSAEKAEKIKEICFQTNTEIPVLLAEACKTHQIKLLTFSSGMVFDGHRKNFYTENDLALPLNIYGQSKAAAEENVLKANPNSLIIRTGTCFSCWENTSLVAAIFNRLKEAQSVTLSHDQFFSLTYVPDLVQESLNMLLDNECGIFHVVNDGRTTAAALAGKIAEMAWLDGSLIKAVSAKQLKQTVALPQNMALKSKKGIELPHFESALRHYLDTVNHAEIPEEIAV